MDALFYLSPFFTAFSIVVVCIVLLQVTPLQRTVMTESRKGERHTHKDGVLRFGGVALGISFLVTLFTNSYVILTASWWGVIIATLLILVVGLWDDIREISWKSQMLVQIVAGGIAFAFGIRMLSLTNPFGGAIFFDSGWSVGVSFVVTVVWILVVMNAVNWADGIDGLCGGVAFIGFITIFIVSLRPEVNQPPVAILSLALAGASLGFLMFNFYPAQILAGTSGAWFLGFMLAVLALFSGTKIATAALVLSLPILDAALVIASRFRAGVSIFSPDQRHLHHRLRKRGWSPRGITLFFYSVTICIAVISLRASVWGKVLTLCGVVVFVCAIFLWVQKK